MRERRQHQDEPGEADRPAAEMAEVGVERFGAGHRQKHRAERVEPDHAVLQQKVNAVERIERQQHLEIVPDMPKPGNGDGDEPDQA